MNNEILNYLYMLCENSTNERIQIPSIRALSIKFNISTNDVIHVINHYKDLNIIISLHGSKNILIKTDFLKTFKHDFTYFFGVNITRKLISQNITKINNKFFYTFEREIIKDNKIVALSIDNVFLSTKNENFNNSKGIDEFIKTSTKGSKIVKNKIQTIELQKNTNEYKKLQSQFVMIMEVKIFIKNNILISHSFSIMPIKYFEISNIKIMT